MPWPAIEWSKIVLTGAKSRNDIYQAFENIYPVLLEFKKSYVSPRPWWTGKPPLARKRKLRED